MIPLSSQGVWKLLLFFAVSKPVIVTINQEADLASMDGKRNPA
jgi:hypothetical protein